MKKRKFLINVLTGLCVCLMSACILTACKEEHVHNYTETVTAPTCTEQGFTTHTCSCNDSYVDTYVDAFGHDFQNYISNGDATCTENGTETATCSRDGCTETDTRTKENSAFNHDYGVLTYTWNENQCTATRVCTRDNTHVETETITAEYVKDTGATCTTAETGHYIATFENVAFETQTTNEDTVVNGEPLNHNYVAPTYVWDGYECTATRVCARDSTHTETETVMAVYVKDTDVTCDTPETGHYKATFNNSAFTEQNTAKDSVENGCALNHSYGAPTYTWNGNQCTAKRICANDITHVETETVTGIYEKDMGATCDEPEKGHYVATFENSAFKTQTTAINSVENGEKLGHDFTSYTYDNNATCEENGTETATCSRDNCEEPDTREKANTKLGHTYGTPTYAWIGNQCTATRICERDNAHVETETVTGTYEKDTDVTCTAPEKGHYIATFKNSVFTTQITADNTVENGEKLGHSFIDYIYNNNATCTENGTETATCSRDNCDEPYTRVKENSALGHDWTKDGNPIVNCTLSGGKQSYKCGRCTATKNEAVTTVSSGAPDMHSNLSVGEVCQYCGKEVLAKNGSSLVMEINDTNYQVEHYAGKAVGFSKYKDYIKTAYISNSVTEIGNDAFYNYSALTSVEIPNSVTKIGNYVFYGCTSLKNIIILDSVTSLGIGVFEGCTGLKTLVLGNGLTEIEEGLLSGCSALESLTIPFVGASKDGTSNTHFGYIFGANSYSYNDDYVPASVKKVTITSVTSISNYAFYGCSSLTAIVILDGVTSIGDYAFRECDSLTEVVIGNGVESIGNGAFYYCDSLIEVVIGNGVESIGYFAFYSCGGLMEIVIPNSVTSIGESAFDACFELTGVYYQGTIETWCNIVFNNSDANPLYYARKLYIDNTLVTEIEIPDTVTEIKNYTFSRCRSLTEIKNLDGVTSIGNYAFYGCSGLTEIIIPDSVTSIADYAFSGCSGLTEIIIPDSVKSIGESAFSGCTGLTEIVIPNSVTSIADYAFSGCSGLTEIIIPDSVTIICESAFSGCTGLTEIAIPNGVTSIGESAFSRCTGLTEIVIPNGVTSIGEGAFQNCSGLTEIVISDSVTSIGGSAFYGCSGLTEIKYNAIGCEDLSRNNAFGDAGKNTDGITVTIGASVKKIPANLFSSYYSNYYSVYKPKITHIVFEEGSICESIGDGAFRDCDNLTELVIPDSVTSIGNSAFYNCSSLMEIIIPDSVTSIGNSAFSGCIGLTEIVIPDGVTSIGESAFNYCIGLTKITLPFVGASANATSASASTLFGYIFGAYIHSNSTSYNTWQYYSSSEYVGYYIPPSLQSVTITGGNIFYGAFYDCWNLRDVVIDDKVTNIAPYAFYDCVNLSKVIMSDNITTIGNYAFSGCTDLTEIVIPNGVTSIGGSAFSGCSGLTEIVIPNNVKWIGEGAFFGCSGLIEMTLPFVGGSSSATSASNSTLFGYIFGTNAFDGGTEIKQYYSSSSYSYSTYYIPTGLQSVTITGGDILYGAFSNCSNLTNVAIGEAVTSISDSAFDGCDSLVYSEYSNAYYLGNDENEFYALIKAKNTDITRCIMNDGTGLIADRAFYNCSGLTEIVILDGVTRIGGYAFFGCSGLTEIIIPNGVTSIRDYTFFGCTGLKEIVIPDNVTSIGSSAFSGCSGLMKMTLPFVGASKDGTSNTHFGYIFGANSYSYNDDYVPASVKKVTITSVTSISNYAFYGCSSLTAIVIPDSVESIGNSAFDGCSGLTELVIPAGVTTIGNYAFYGCSGLTELVIPAGVTIIGDSAFSGCSGLQYTIENNCRYLGSSTNPYLYLVGAVSKDITTATINQNCKFIGSSAFYKCTSLTNIVIPDSVESIGNGAFYECSRLTEIMIPINVNFMGEEILGGRYTSDRELIIYCEASEKPDGWSSEWNQWLRSSGSGGYYSVYYSAKWGYKRVAVDDIIYGIKDNVATIVKTPQDIENLTIVDSITYQNTVYSVTGIGDSAFAGCDNLTSIVLPESVTSIGTSAFEGCNNLTSIVIPESVTSIGASAFSGCSSLTIYCEVESQPSGWASFNCPVVWDCNNNHIADDGYIYVLVDNIRYGIKDGVAMVAPQMRNIKTANIPTSIIYENSAYRITSIAYCAFYHCESLTNVEIPVGVTSIDDYAFGCCYSLTEIVIPDGIKNIGQSAFYDCRTLTSIEISDSVTSIGDYAFYGCDSITIYCELKSQPSGWSSHCFPSRPMIWNYAGTKGVTDNGITWAQTKDNTIVITGYTKAVARLVVPDTINGCPVLEIAERAFEDCSSLTSIEIPNSVMNIGYCAFYGCNRLTIYCEAESKPSGWDTHWNCYKMVWSNDYQQYYYYGCSVVWGERA